MRSLEQKRHLVAGIMALHLEMLADDLDKQAGGPVPSLERQLAETWERLCEARQGPKHEP